MCWLIIDVSYMFSTKSSFFTLKPCSTAHWLWGKVKTLIHIFLNNSKCFCPFKHANINLSRRSLTKWVSSSLLMERTDFVNSSKSSLVEPAVLAEIRSAQCNFSQSEPNCVSVISFSWAILMRDKLAAFLTTIYFFEHLSFTFSTIWTSVEMHSFLNLCFAPSFISFDRKLD